jgi:hypothetical protein
VGWVWASVLRRCLGCTCALQAVAEAERDVSANFAEQLRAAGVTVPVVGVGTPAVAATSNGYAAAAAVPLPSPRWEIIALEIISHPGFAASSHDEIVDARTHARRQHTDLQQPAGPPGGGGRAAPRQLHLQCVPWLLSGLSCAELGCINRHASGLSRLLALGWLTGDGVDGMASGCQMTPRSRGCTLAKPRTSRCGKDLSVCLPCMRDMCCVAPALVNMH